MMMMIKSRHLL